MLSRWLFGFLIGTLFLTGCESGTTTVRETDKDATGRVKFNAPGVNVDVQRNRDDQGTKVDVDVQRKKD
jgi:hypothetical protein